MKSRLDTERHVVEVMIRLYCRRKEGNAELCPQCAGLLAYARQRLGHCPWAEAKPTCRHCTIHCYSPSMRAQMQQVMRWAGPRMAYCHPLLALRHLLHSRRR